MKKNLKKLRMILILVFSGLSFLGGLTIGIPLLLGKIIWHTTGSIYVTQYIYAALAAFFLVFLGILPFIRRIFIFFKISKINPFDVLATILLIFVSGVPLILLALTTFFILFISDKIFKRLPYGYLYVVGLIGLFLLGVHVRPDGKFDPRARILPINHTSPLDYLLCLLVTFARSWNAIAGINLKRNKKTIEDKLVSFFVGGMIARYTINVDREVESSRKKAMRGTINEINSGKRVIFFPEGGRTPKAEFKSGIILRKFHDKVFRYAYENKILTQPIAFDCPLLWRGKDDDLWGIRVTTIDIHYLDVIDPNDYESAESFLQACWDSIYGKLFESQKIQRFLNS